MRIAITGICVVIVGLALGACRSEAPQPTAAEMVERGRYLVTVGGCNDCHTPWKLGETGPEPDRTRLLSGHPEAMQPPPPPQFPTGPWGLAGTLTKTAWAGPWGVSYSANLTPDEETGIGAWDENMFVSAMRTGQHLGAGRPILPPMPWQNLSQATDEDLKAMFSYLKSVKPIRNRVPEPIPPAPPRP
jgi:hypothetical protein